MRFLLSCTTKMARLKKSYALLYVSLLAGISFWGTYIFSGGPYGGDDLMYLNLAMFPRAEAGRLNRFVHIYLLKISLWVSGGDPFLSAKILWSFTFAVTVVCLAFMAKALGPRLQVTVLLITLFMFFGQSVIFMFIGVALADYTVMMFITAAVAVYICSLQAKQEFRHLYAFIIGALTLWAVKSKEVGIILAWLPLLFVFENGRVCFKAFRKKILFWCIGALLAFLLLMMIDAIILGDFWFSIRPSSIQHLLSLNVAHPEAKARSADSWLDLVWESGLKWPGIFVVLAATLATYKRKNIELRLLHVMPLAYLFMLMLAHTKGTFWLNPRHLVAIIPVTCFFASTFFYYSGINRTFFTHVYASKCCIPMSGFTLVTLSGVLLYYSDWLKASVLLPATVLQRFGWSPEDFLSSILIPIWLLLVLILSALFFRHSLIRPVILIILLAVLSGATFCHSLKFLAAKPTLQRGERILYPLRVFKDDVTFTKDTRILISQNLPASKGGFSEYWWMNGVLIRLFFRIDIQAITYNPKGMKVDYAYLTPDDYENWKRIDPIRSQDFIVKTEPKGVVLLAISKSILSKHLE